MVALIRYRLTILWNRHNRLLLLLFIALISASAARSQVKATGMRCSLPQSQAAFNRYEFYYTTGDSPHAADSTETPGTTCKQGLWIAYVSQIMEQLSMQAKILSVVNMTASKF